MQEILQKINADQKELLELLFDAGQHSCYTDSPHGYKVSAGPEPHDLFFCINALDFEKDNDPTKSWHDPNKPRRADANVVCYRNFLIELDNVPLEEQISYVCKIVPVSSIVYSGGKSYHFIISLEKPLDLDTYKIWAKRLHKLLPKADKACKNPSRLSRLPGVVRPETGRKQRLHSVGSRIPNAKLESLLPQLKKKQVYTQTEKARFIPSMLVDACVNPDETIRRFNLGGRNAFFFWLHKRMEEAAFTESQQEIFVEQAYNNLLDVTGFSWEEAQTAARIRNE